MPHPTKTGLLVTIVTGLSLMAHAQQPGDTLKKQSAYYDALVLYYASNGINAYPLAKDPSSSQTLASPAYQMSATSRAMGELVENNIKADANVVGGKNNTSPRAASPAKDSSRTASPTKDSSRTQPDSNAVAALKTGADGPDALYIVYESSTGKVLKDNVPRADLDSELNKHSFGSTASNLEFIAGVLSRNLDSDTMLPQGTILERYETNTYFHDTKVYDMLKNGFTPEPFIRKDGLLKEPLMLTGSNAGGGSSMTDLIINGVTDYLIDQVNAEFDEAFLSRLRKELDKKKALGILFPETLASLKRIKVSQYTQALSTIRSAYRADIANLLGHVSGLAGIDDVRAKLKTDPSLALVFAGCDVVSMLRDGVVPAEILARVGSASYVREFRDSSDYASVLASAALLSNSLRDVHVGELASAKDSWVLPGRITMLMNNPRLFELYVSLLVQNAASQKITFSAPGHQRTSLSELLQMKDTAKGGSGAAYLVYNFLHTEQQMEAAVKLYNDAQQTAKAKNQNVPLPVTAAFYTTMANLIVSLAEDVLDMLPSDKVAGPRKAVDKIRRGYLPVLNQMNAVVSALDAKDYNLVVYYSDSILMRVLDPADCDKFVKYGTFISSVAMAKTSDDVKAAIRSIALPTGSSRIKKEHVFSLGLNAYAGAYHADNYAYARNKLPREEWGITAPIGLAFSWGFKYGNGSIGSVSLYGGLVDVGAIFAYKLNQDDSTFVSGIQLGQLLSPSIGLYYGLPVFGSGLNVPLSIGATYQWGPRLKKVSEKGNSVLPAMTSRFNVSLVFDLPILNFHVSRK